MGVGCNATVMNPIGRLMTMKHVRYNAGVTDLIGRLMTRQPMEQGRTLGAMVALGILFCMMSEWAYGPDDVQHNRVAQDIFFCMTSEWALMMGVPMMFGAIGQWIMGWPLWLR